MLRRIGCRAGAMILGLLLSQTARADTSFHVTEIIGEDEIRPRQAHHTVRWQGDFYVSDGGVSILGFGRKGGGELIPYDRPTVTTNSIGTSYTLTVHAVADGIDVTSEYRTFVITRHLVQTGPQSCTDTVAAVLKPGQTLFEVLRLSNHEPMFETRRDVAVTCALPKLLS